MPLPPLPPPPNPSPFFDGESKPPNGIWTRWLELLRLHVLDDQGGGDSEVREIANYVVSGLLGTTPSSASLTMTTPGGVVFINGRRMTVAEETYTYPASKYIQDEISPDGLWIHTAYASYASVPSVPPSGGVYLQQISTSATAIIGVFDRRTLEPMFQELQEFGFYVPKLIQDLTIVDTEGPGACYPVGTVSKRYTGAIRYGANNGILWYFSNLGVFHLIGKLTQTAVLNYLNAYIANLDDDYIAFDVYANADATLQVDTSTGNATPPRPPDSHDSYAATFLMCAARYVRTYNDWGWLQTVNTRFGETNHQTLLNIMVYNLTTQVKTVDWCNAHGIQPYEPAGATLLTSTFQNAIRKEDGMFYHISFLADNCEVYSGLKLFGDLLNDFGDTTNGASALAFATNIGIAAHGLFDVTERVFVPNDTMINFQPDNTYLADALTLGTAWYPDLFCQIFTELYQVPSGGGAAFDGQKYNDGWEYLMGNAPLWWKRTEYDSFPDIFFAYMATAYRKRPDIGEQSLAKFFKYMLTLSPQGSANLGGGVQQSGNTAGFAILSEVGFAVAIQDIIVDRLGTELQAQYPFSTLQVKTVKSAKRAAMPSKVQGVSAFYTILPLGEIVLIGSGDIPVLLQNTPIIGEPDHDGQIITIVNVNEGEIEFQDETILPGAGLQLGGVNLRLAQWDSISFIWLSNADAWIAMSPSMAQTIFGNLKARRVWINQEADDLDHELRVNGLTFLNGGLELIPALPIAQGGTGQTNVEAARAALNAATRNHPHGVNVSGSGSGFAPEGGGLVTIT